MERDGGRMQGEQLNVVLVVLEEARADHLGCYGYERETTPFLDQIAAEGVRFTHAFTAAPAALPAHASILTGTFPSVHGATEESGALAVSLPTLPARLKASGYRSAAFCSHPGVSPETGFGRGFDRFYSPRASGRITGRAADYARRASDRVLGRSDAGARRTNQAVREWIVAQPGPFFAYVTYREPAEPARTPAPYDRVFLPAGSDAAPEVLALAAYDGALHYADLRLRELSEDLRALGRWEHTLLIVTATHGTSLPGRPGSALADGVLRVPLLLRCPSRIPRGFVVDAFAQSTDLLPTILPLVGVSGEQIPAQGRVLLGENGAIAGPDAVFAEAFRSASGDGPAAARTRRKALRTRREKFVWQSDEDNALFDLTRDPAEQHNLVARDTGRADRLRRRLFDWLAASERWAEQNGVAAANGADDRAHEQRGAHE